MSRVLKNYNNQITNSYANHTGWSHGVDVVGYKNNCDFITAHSTGVVVKVVDYMTFSNYNGENGTGRVLDKDGMGYGNYVIIRHNENFCTLYAHMEPGSVKVVEGQRVGKGDAIGFMGTTGHSYGKHLHFEIRQITNKGEITKNWHNTDNFVFIDPTPYLDTELPGINPKTEPTKVTYFVQAGAYQVKTSADAMVMYLKTHGINAIIKYNGDYYRIQAGAYSERKNAENMLNKLATFKVSAFITKSIPGKVV